MGLPRTFVGFSSTDIKSCWLMLAWKANDNIDSIFPIASLIRKLIQRTRHTLRASAVNESVWWVRSQSSSDRTPAPNTNMCAGKWRWLERRAAGLLGSILMDRAKWLRRPACRSFGILVPSLYHSPQRLLVTPLKASICSPMTTGITRTESIKNSDTSER